MPRTIDITPGSTISDELAALLIRRHHNHTRPALRRLWDYYRNELDFTAGDDQRPYRAGQEQGLPSRLVGSPGRVGSSRAPGGGGKEVVIENDIAWRIHTLVDFMFGKPVAIESLADDPGRAAVIERVLRAVFDANGGVCFFQDLALLGSVYGFVDVLVRFPETNGLRPPASRGVDADPPASRGLYRSGSGAGSPAARVPSRANDAGRAIRYASKLMLETVEAPRAIPVLDPSDYRRLDGYMLHYTKVLNRVERGGFLSRLMSSGPRGSSPWGSAGRQATVEVTERWTPGSVTLYHDDRLVSAAPNALGRLPVVHIQNLPQPFFYEGLSEVEPLIPLQDELNTRLSDRANRVTLQSFKMYLGRGIERFNERPVGPGQMWMTENPDASIEAFGGDGDSPSERAHIQEIREAMDKASAVTGVAAGLLRNKVGNLTSENALRITMMGLLAKTEKKRIAYGKGIERVCELALAAMDAAGVLRTRPEERRVRLHWPSPLPENETQRLDDALKKAELGVPRQRVLAELGYELDF